MKRLAAFAITLGLGLLSGCTPSVSGGWTKPGMTQAVWINKPRRLDEHDQLPRAGEPGARVARPTEWRSALAGRSLDGEVASSPPATEEEPELVAAH